VLVVHSCAVILVFSFVFLLLSAIASLGGFGLTFGWNVLVLTYSYPGHSIVNIKMCCFHGVSQCIWGSIFELVSMFAV
jgi:hypothetical protein